MATLSVRAGETQAHTAVRPPEDLLRPTRTMSSRSVVAFLITLVALAIAPLAQAGSATAATTGVDAASAGPTGLVISEVYGGGGNSGSTYENDFIELQDTGSATVDLDSYSVQYASATGTSWQVTALGAWVTNQPGSVRLV